MIDLIIPLYNSNMIDETLASILYQTDTDINIYLIDDCSTISYTKTVKFYKKYLNVNILRLKENSGPGVARQYGIEHSNSPYIMFMDSDDSLGSPVVIENIKKIIENDEYDLVIGDFAEEVDNGIVFHYNDEIWMHGKVYSRKFILDNHVHFNDTRKNEDNFFNQLMLLHKPRIYHYQEIVYIYRNNSQSITRINNHEYNYEGNIYYAYNISEAMREAKEDNCDSFLISSIGYRALIAIYFYYNEFIDKDVSKFVEYSKRIFKLIDFSMLDDGLLNSYLVNHLKYMVDSSPESLVENTVTFSSFMRMIGDIND